jgi:integrase
MLRAFCLALRYTGQRVSDVAMLGPHSIVTEGERYFVALTQIKTCNKVKVPVPAKLVEALRALLFRGETSEPFVHKTRRQKIPYGTQFWFWTGKSKVQSNIQSWLDDVSRVLAVCQQTQGQFQHHPTPHSFRHFFAVTMLSAGVAIEKVSKWLGHSDVKTTQKHYGYLNSDWHVASHDTCMDALDKIEGKRTKTGKVVRMKRVG